MKKYQTIDARTLREIVVYCSSRSCTASPTLAQKLVDLGFSEVIDFEGGIDEWERHGFPMRGTRAMAVA